MTSARPLTTDDISGVCDVYGPLAGKLGCFLEVDNNGIGGSCSVAPPAEAPHGRDFSLALAAFVTLGILVLRGLRRGERARG